VESLKKSSPEPFGSILIRLDTNHPWGRGFKFVQRKGIAPHQEEIIAKV
jgi:hypothetical protein